jgi:glutamate racemase
MRSDIRVQGMAGQQMNNNNTARPVGIFDSGMGGLTVLKAIREKLPSENIMYFGDTAHLPYGNKSPEAVKRYSLSIADFLTARQIKMLVVACNTASVFALDELSAGLDIPVVGVVDPGVRSAVAAAGKAVAVIGTYGTVKSGVYQDKIAELNPQLAVYSKPCPLFVPLVEEGWTGTEVTREVARIYLEEFCDKVDAVILACTHYPMLKDVIKKTLGDSVSVVDSATEVAGEAASLMERSGIINSGDKPGTIEYYVSDLTENLKRTGEIFMNSPMGDVKEVQID